MNKMQRILAALLVIQIVIVAAIYLPKGSSAQSDASLFDEAFKVDDIVSITIESGENESVTLTKMDANWVLPEAGDYPAKSETIQPVLEKIAAINTNRLVTRTASSHARLQVSDDNFLRRVNMTLSDASQYILYIGSSSGARATHVRLAGNPEVYLVSDISSWEVAASASNWIDSGYMQFSSDSVQNVVMENGNGSFQFEKDADSQWTMIDLQDDQEFDPAKLTAILNRLSSLQMVEPLGTQELDGYGTAKPAATITITTQNDGEASQTHQLSVGSQDENGNYIVYAAGAQYYVTVADFSVRELVDYTREDFIKQPATPTPEG